MTSFSTVIEINRTVFVATTETVVGLVVEFHAYDGTVITVNRWTRDDTGYRAPVNLPAGSYVVKWSALSPRVTNTYLSIEFDPAHVNAGANVTVTENADAESWRVASTGGMTCTVVDGGLADSSYASIDPIDGGTASL